MASANKLFRSSAGVNRQRTPFQPSSAERLLKRSQDGKIRRVGRERRIQVLDPRELVKRKQEREALKSQDEPPVDPPKVPAQAVKKVARKAAKKASRKVPKKTAKKATAVKRNGNSTHS